MAEDAPASLHVPEEIKRPLIEQAHQRIQIVQKAAEIVGGPGAKIVEVFDPPTPKRDDAPMPKWTDDESTYVRKIARELGYGAEHDVLSGIYGGVRIIEGGKVWKMIAEAEVVKNEEGVSQYVFAGSPYEILGDDEVKFLKDEYGVTLKEGATQYDAARWLAEREVANPNEVTLPFGYEVAEGNPFVHEETGQFLSLGTTSDDKEVVLLRIDREPYIDENEKPKYRFQPKTEAVMEMVAQTLTAEPEAPVVIVTSNTYASRQVGAMRAGLKHRRQSGVVMYGRNTLNGLFSENTEIEAPVPKELPLNHLPGDLRNTYDKLQLLLAELGVKPDTVSEE